MILLFWYVLISSCTVLRWAGGFKLALVRLRIKIAIVARKGGEMVEIEHTVM